MWRSRVPVLALLGLLAAACGPQPGALGGLPGRPIPPGQPGQPGQPGYPGAGATSRSGFLVLRASARQFTPGHAVVLTLVNNTDRVVSFSACNAALEREIDGRWVEPGHYGGGMCAPTATPVPPGAFARETVTLPSDLPPARYRYRLELESGEPGGQATALSNVFRVR